MEDLANYLLRMEMHKNKGEFGTMLNPNGVKKRMNQMNQQRKNKRDNLMSQRRQIDDNVSMMDTIQENNNENDKKDACNRLEKLAMWKAEKEKKKLAEKKNSKPIFITCVRSEAQTLKGKDNVNSKLNQSEFAPKNHKFKAPSNVEPIYFQSNSTRPRMMTRSNSKNSTLSFDSAVDLKKTKTVNTVDKLKNNKSVKPKLEKASSLNINETSKTVNMRSSQKVMNKTLTTPTKNNIVNKTKKTPQNPNSSIVKKTPKSNKKVQQNTSLNLTQKTNTPKVNSTKKAMSIDGGLFIEKSTKISTPSKSSISKNNDENNKTNDLIDDTNFIKNLKKTPKSLKKSKSLSNNDVILEQKNTPEKKRNSRRTLLPEEQTISKTPKPLAGKTPKKVKELLNDSKLNTEIIKSPKPTPKPRRKSSKKEESIIIENNENIPEYPESESKIIEKIENNRLSTNELNTSENVLNESTKSNKQNKRSSSSTIGKDLSSDMSPLVLEDNCNEANSTFTLSPNKSINLASPKKSPNLNCSIPLKTPENAKPANYISPFVTLSRGKQSARKEYIHRKLGNVVSPKTDAEQLTSPSAGANYFTVLLNNEISRIEEMNQWWTDYKETENIAEEAHSVIDTTIGQANLLLTKKFEQFRGLIESCKQQDGDQRITCEDLHGFWDMIYIQVENIDKRFKNLEQLKANNWEEIIPVPKAKPVAKRGRRAKNAKATSGLRQAILAAKRQKQTMESPCVEIVTSKKTPKRKSLLTAVQNNENSSRKSSPGLTMMKVAQFAKNFETPNKGILKTDTSKSTGKSKAVVFRDDIENDVNITNSLSKVILPKRRSSRLSRTKLF